MAFCAAQQAAAAAAALPWLPPRRPFASAASCRHRSSFLGSRHPLLPRPGQQFPSPCPCPSASPSSLSCRAVILDPSHLESAAQAASSAAASSHTLLFHIADAAKEASSAAAGVAVTLADAAAAAGDAAVQAVPKEDGGWFGGLADLLEVVLKTLEQGLASLHVPYAYGFSIILLTFLVKLATYPLTKKQVESTLAMQNLAPKLKVIQTKFAGDQERIQLETARMYKQAGVNPLAGCLPTLATLPIWIGLYQALSNVAKEGVLTEGFFWIPSLAGPTSLAARDSGSGISWLFPLVNGAPPLGWSATAAYLVLPVLLVASQYYSMQILQPPQSDDPAQKQTQLILKFLPIMIGWFALSVPSGLSLYWFTNNVLSTAQTVYLRQMGGAKPSLTAESAAEIIDVGQAKRSTPSATTVVDVAAAPTTTSIATTTATATAAAGGSKTETDAARAERFRQRKEAEKERRAAKRAAEEAARASAAKAAEEREQLRQQQQQERAAAAAVAAARAEADGGNGAAPAVEEDEDEDGSGVSPAVVPSSAAASASVRRSKRSRRVRK